jgi:hypothetical protein
LEPRPGLVRLGGVEIADFRKGKRLAHLGHPLFPFPVADEGDALDVGAVLGGELDVVPEGVQVPAVEVLKLGQQPALPCFATAASTTGTNFL